MVTRSAAFTVSGATVAALSSYLSARGFDLGPALARLGLERTQLASPEFRVPASANDALWAEAERLTGETDFGLRFAKRLDLDAFHLVGHLAASSPTLGVALERVVRFSRLLHDAGRTEVERHHGRVLLFPGCRGLPRPPPRQIAEFNTASAVVLIRFITARLAWAPREVSFHHDAPRDVEPHRALFGRAPRFGAAEDVIVLEEADLALPVRVSAPSRIGQYLESYAATLLAQLPESADEVREQVLRAIVSSLPSGGTTLESVAGQLSMTPRTLQRRLTDDGTTFSEIVEDARLTTAEHHLADERLTLAEISFLLGFNEPSTFHKAFRRWTGLSPGAWRQRAISKRPVARNASRVSRHDNA